MCFSIASKNIHIIYFLSMKSFLKELHIFTPYLFFVLHVYVGL